MAKETYLHGKRDLHGKRELLLQEVDNGCLLAFEGFTLVAARRKECVLAPQGHANKEIFVLSHTFLWGVLFEFHYSIHWGSLY